MSTPGAKKNYVTWETLDKRKKKEATNEKQKSNKRRRNATNEEETSSNDDSHQDEADYHYQYEECAMKEIGLICMKPNSECADIQSIYYQCF